MQLREAPGHVVRKFLETLLSFNSGLLSLVYDIITSVCSAVFFLVFLIVSYHQKLTLEPLWQFGSNVTQLNADDVPGYDPSPLKMSTVKQLQLDLEQLAWIFLPHVVVKVCAILVAYLGERIESSDPKKNRTAATFCRRVSIALHFIGWVLKVVAAYLLLHLAISVNEPLINKAATDLVWDASDKDDIPRSALLNLQIQPNMECCGVTVPNEHWNTNSTRDPNEQWRRINCISEKLPSCTEQFLIPNWLTGGFFYYLFALFFVFTISPFSLFYHRWNKIGEKKKSTFSRVIRDAETGIGRPPPIIQSSAPDDHPKDTAADGDANSVGAKSFYSCDNSASDADDATEESTQMLNC